MTKATPISIFDFDERAENEKGVEIELVTASGKRTGIHVTVIGEQSEKVQAHVFRSINARRRQDMANARKGKNAEVRPIEEDVALAADKAVVSVSGWRGPKEDFNEGNLRRLLEKNPTFVTQILEASADSAAFTGG
ncbi:MAG: hypothetical protein GX086_03570 [Alcaligenaceae bacterium]|nr:hypothetical protein [Alcaligenaceae bacterium]